MKKARLTKILVEGNRDLLKKMAQQVEKRVEVKVEQPPRKGLVMLKARDSISMQPFYLGEGLVTECSVSIQGKFGFGAIMGEDPERSYQIAVVDAAFNARLPLVDSWIPELEREERSIRQRHFREHVMAEHSRVQFDTMEDYNDKS